MLLMRKFYYNGGIIESTQVKSNASERIISK